MVYEHVKLTQRGWMINRELISALEDPQRFHYKDLWQQEQDVNLRNLLELFAFGTCEDMNSQAGTLLTDRMLMKLRKQTVISLSATYRTIPYDIIRQKCRMDDISDIETMLMQLRDVFEVELDSVRQTATIKACYDSRDVYSGEWQLNVVNPAFVTTKQTLQEDLISWKRKLLRDILDI